ncbi:MAG: hypothetical protein ACI31S_01325 [Bacilli bacterium]
MKKRLYNIIDKITDNQFVCRCIVYVAIVALLSFAMFLCNNI